MIKYPGIMTYRTQADANIRTALLSCGCPHVILLIAVIVALLTLLLPLQWRPLNLMQNLSSF